MMTNLLILVGVLLIVFTEKSLGYQRTEETNGVGAVHAARVSKLRVNQRSLEESPDSSISAPVNVVNIPAVAPKVESVPTPPTFAPTLLPTFSPTLSPVANPTLSPTYSPTLIPTYSPTLVPTYSPTVAPTFLPTLNPTFSPTLYPTFQPSAAPTVRPTEIPTASPTVSPTEIPTASPTVKLHHATPLDQVENLIFENHTFIFIGGTHFSGTSITERLLSSQKFSSGLRVDLYSVASTEYCHLLDPTSKHRCVAPENEGGFVTLEFSRLYTSTNRICSVEPFYEWGSCAESFHLTEKDVASINDGPEISRNRMLRDWSMWWNINHRYLVEKDIPNLVQSRFLQTLFTPQKTRFVFMIRHPLGACKYFQCNISSQIESWLTAYRVLARDLPSISNYVVLHQETFLTNASVVVNELKTFLHWDTLEYIDSSRDPIVLTSERRTKRKLYFHGETGFDEDYLVTIGNNAENLLWNNVYPKLIHTYPSRIHYFESRLNKFCYSMYTLHPICNRVYWKRSY